MTVGILGLGLIGGSMARAYALAGHTVLAKETDESTLSFAMLSGAVHGVLEPETIPKCDLILLAIYPGGSAGSAIGVSRLRSVTDLPLWAAIPWRVPIFLALSTAGQTCIRVHLWCWCPPDMMILSSCSG